jgi:peptidyl-prolyl cis-trans isomerase D
MRRHKSWLKWSLALVVLTFVLFYIPDFLAGTSGAMPTTSNEVVASVEGLEVTAGEFRRRYQIQMQAYRGAYGESLNDRMLRQLGIDRQILQSLIDEKAAVAEAARQGIAVSDEEVAHQILALPGFQENGVFIGQARYAQVLRAQRPPLMPADYERELRNGMMIDRLRSAVAGWLTVPDAEIEREYRRRNEKVKLQIVSVPSLSFRDKVTVADADVAARFDAKKEDYRVGEKRKVRFLLVDFTQARQRTVIPEADIVKLYNDNLAQYSTPEQIRASHILFRTEGKDEAAVRAQAEQVLKQVRAGGDFAALAKQHSEDEANKEAGGDLDYFGRGRMVPEFEAVAFEMQNGQTSDLVKTPFGFHIIKLTDKKTATTRTLADVKPELTEQLKFERSQQAVTDQAKSLAGQIKAPADLDTVGKAAGLTVTESGFFTKDEPIPGIGPASQAAQEAFRLKDGEISAVVGTPRGPVIFVLAGTTPPRLPALDEVKARVKDDLVAERAAAMARARAVELAAKLKGAKDFAAAAKKEGVEVKDTELIARGAAIPEVGVVPEVEKAVFALSAGAVSEPLPTPMGSVVLQVAERHDVTAEEFGGAKAAFRREFENERRSQFFTAYLTKAKQKMAIVVNDEALRRAIGDE